MAYTDHPSYNRPNLRHSLERLNHSVAALTSALEDLWAALDDRDAQVLTLDFGTNATVLEEAAATPTARNTPSRDDFPRIRSPWSKDEDDQLRFALGLGFDYKWIAERVGRTSQACQDRAYTLRKGGRL